MRGELVAVDLETTGLDPMKDAIIEVGAVRIKNGEIIEEFSTMVNPNCQIPAQTTHITGIRQADVTGAPVIESVLPEISRFVGSAPVIAHNISLDMGFLSQRYQILKSNPRIDTYELASVLTPKAPRYNLNSLTSEVGIELSNAHRALDDARATALLYWKLWEKALKLPLQTLREISTAADGIKWDASEVFSAAVQEKLHFTPSQTIPEPNDDDPLMEAFSPEPSYQHEETSNIEADSIQSAPLLDDVTRIFSADGALSEGMPTFEYRTEQQQMAEAIATALSEAQHLMVEAGTGTGKSIAYLIPAILWALRSGERVLISTNTIALQDQLINKDIPDLKRALSLDFSAVVMKGRGNYLCPRRLETARRRQPSSVVELRTLAKILVWLLENPSGDRGEISLRGPVENTVWSRLSAQDEGCTLHRCEAMMGGGCPFYKARKAAEHAQIVIVNHALLIADVHTDNQVLPEYQYAIIDEAHQLEDAITSGMSFHIDQSAIDRRLTDLGSANRGLLGELLIALRDNLPDKDLLKLEQFIQAVGQSASAMSTHITALFNALETFAHDARNIRSNDFTTLLRITPQLREKPAFSYVQEAWNTVDEFFEVIGDAIGRLAHTMDRKAANIPDSDALLASLETAARYLMEIRSQINAFVNKPENNTIYWLTLSHGEASIVLHSAPLHVGPLTEKYIWQQKKSVILTSATLRTHDSFDYIKDRLYAEDVRTFEIGSPFDYRTSTLVYIPNDIPEPNDRHGYQRAVERGIIELAAALDGRVLVLFTSYAQLRQTSQAITARLALGNILVYDQSDGSSRQALLDGFKTTDKAVLLGTRSFWEGVDIVGDALSALVIVRLPFAVPTDPIFSARGETYTDTFSQYALPDAILRFRQGFGRLIRSSSDRGIVTIFDSRIITKSYGAQFLEALPDCTMRDGSLDALPEIAVNWLNRQNEGV